MAIDAAWLEVDNIERRAGLSLADFREQFELPNKPVILTDVVRALSPLPCMLCMCWLIALGSSHTGTDGILK